MGPRDSTMSSQGPFKLTPPPRNKDGCFATAPHVLPEIQFSIVSITHGSLSYSALPELERD